MISDADLYFETRLAFSDRPNARIRLADQPGGGVEVIVREPIPANPHEPDHLKAKPWIRADPPSFEQHVMRPRVVMVVGRLDALARWGPGSSASALAERLRARWQRELRAYDAD